MTSPTQRLGAAPGHGSYPRRKSSTSGRRRPASRPRPRPSPRERREPAPRDVPGDHLRLRRRERVLRPPRHERRAADQADLLLHPVPAAGAVPLPDLLARPERVGDEPRQEIRPLLRIEALPDLPELGQVGAVRLRLDVVDAVPARAVAPVAIGRVDVGARGEHEPLDAIRMGRRQLHRDHGARMVPDDGQRPDAETVEQRDGPASVVLDVAPPVRLVRLAVADRVHGDHPPLPRQDGDDLAILVPRARRLVKEQDGPAGAGRHVVDLAIRRVQEPSVHRALLLVSGRRERPEIGHGSPDRARRGLSTVIRW